MFPNENDLDIYIFFLLKEHTREFICNTTDELSLWEMRFNDNYVFRNMYSVHKNRSICRTKFTAVYSLSKIMRATLYIISSFVKIYLLKRLHEVSNERYTHT